MMVIAMETEDTAASKACSHVPFSYAGPRRAQESQAMMCKHTQDDVD